MFLANPTINWENGLLEMDGHPQYLKAQRNTSFAPLHLCRFALKIGW
jgi:hypothetical protein